MKLYHGSNVEVNNPRILPAIRNLDFGNGFYLATDYEQAKKWSISTVKRRKMGETIVSVFEIRDEDLKKLEVKRFDSPNEDWLKFVVDNRKKILYDDTFDIIIGPVADDNTMPAIDLYFQGFLTANQTIERLLPQKLKDQVVFKKERALQKLHFIESFIIKE